MTTKKHKRLTNAEADEVVESVLSTMWERRPFKWDLGKMMTEQPVLWKEMMKTMRDDLRQSLSEQYEKKE